MKPAAKYRVVLLKEADAPMTKAKLYNGTLDGARQITAEERIAAVIFETLENSVDGGGNHDYTLTEQDCADLGSSLLRVVLAEFRPDYFDHTPNTKKRTPPDPEDMNEQRATWAGAAIAIFRDANGTDEGDAVCDLLADLGHWCDRHGYDFQAELRRAGMHYTEETNGKGKQFRGHASTSPHVRQ